MADEADLAQARSEYELSVLLARRLPQGPAPTGYCLWCGEPLMDARRWCSAECRDDFEVHQSFDRRHHQ